MARLRPALADAGAPERRLRAATHHPRRIHAVALGRRARRRPDRPAGRRRGARRGARRCVGVTQPTRGRNIVTGIAVAGRRPGCAVRAHALRTGPGLTATGTRDEPVRDGLSSCRGRISTRIESPLARRARARPAARGRRRDAAGSSELVVGPVRQDRIAEARQLGERPKVAHHRGNTVGQCLYGGQANVSCPTDGTIMASASRCNAPSLVASSHPGKLT